MVMDSQTASLSLGLLAISAAKLAREGLPLEELAEAVQSEVPLTHCILALDTLEYLQKGGRIDKAQAFLGSVLSVKPILKVEDGEVHPVERPRNMDRAVRRLAELAGDLQIGPCDTLAPATPLSISTWVPADSDAQVPTRAPPLS